MDYVHIIYIYIYILEPEAASRFQQSRQCCCSGFIFIPDDTREATCQTKLNSSSFSRWDGSVVHRGVEVNIVHLGATMASFGKAVAGHTNNLRETSCMHVPLAMFD